MLHKNNEPGLGNDDPVYLWLYIAPGPNELTHIPLDKMYAFSQT